MSIRGKKYNKGEWAEFYVLLKLLGYGKLYAADNLLRKNPNNYLDILRIIRQELETMPLDYCINKDNQQVIIKNQQEILLKLPMADFRHNADLLFENIKDLKGNSVPAPDEIYDFADIIYVSNPKAPSVKAFERMFGGKNDIYIEVRDSQTSIVSVMGFSIKSKFGQPPTLFNAGSSSQFLYEVSNCDDIKMKEFNDIKDGDNRGWQKCKTYLQTNNMHLSFINTKKSVYAGNMLLVRESMSKIMAWCVEDRLLTSLTDDHQVKETIERMCQANPLNVPNPDVYYEKAMKDFLIASFTGMTAGRPWNGREQVSGGYIVVLENGDVLCYHSTDREAFKDYLYRNTYFDYVSAKKYNWSKIEKTEDKYYLSLNLSIRFLKGTR